MALAKLTQWCLSVDLSEWKSKSLYYTCLHLLNIQLPSCYQERGELLGYPDSCFPVNWRDNPLCGFAGYILLCQIIGCNVDPQRTIQLQTRVHPNSSTMRIVLVNRLELALSE